MKDTDLGTVVEVKLKDVWQSEAGEFTPWLAAHIDLLEGVLHREIDPESILTESSVGVYRADIECKDASDESTILIENQLEKTDHRHMGQLLTYAAGLDAVTIIWIARSFSEEHRATLDWLNRITPDKFEFFGLEIKLWQIGESLPAPKFEIVARPNELTRSLTRSTSPTKETQRAYWIKFRDYLTEENSKLSAHAAQPQNWMPFAIGKTGFNLQATALREGMDVSVNIPVKYFSQFENRKREFDELLACDLDISRGRTYSRLIHRHEFDLFDDESWQVAMSWMKERLESFDGVFRELIQNVEEPLVDDDEESSDTVDGSD